MFFTIEEAKKTNLDFHKRTVKVLQIYFAYNYWWSKITIIMEYQKIINLLENTPNQPSKFRAKYWVETKNDSRGNYNTNSQIKFKTTMLMSSLCDYRVMNI